MSTDEADEGTVVPLSLLDQITVEVVLSGQVQCHSVLLHVNL